MTLPPPEHKLDFDSPSVEILKYQLCESLKLRVSDIPEPPHTLTDADVRVAVLFSGGLDCTMLARLAHEFIPASQGIDLINVAFENPRQVAIYKKRPDPPPDIYEACPDRETGRKAFAELKSTCPDRYWRFIAVGSEKKELTVDHQAYVPD